MKLQNTVFLLYHFPQAQQLYHIEPLYLPWYTIKGAVLKIIKENLTCIDTSSEMGCLKGVQEVIEQISSIDMRSNEMHIKISHKLDTAD
jgi:hypothetical protein